jgi:hypothetical protein
MMFDDGDTLIPSKKKKKAGAEDMAAAVKDYASSPGASGMMSFIAEMLSSGNRSRVSRTKMTSV